MKSLLRVIVLAFSPFASAAPLVFEGTHGPGVGRHIVFLAGDHEYRSEETLPALARILAQHHGFKCTVLFNVDATTGEIVPGQPNGVWLWGLGSGGEHRPLFRQLLVCAFHAKSRAVAARPDGGPTAPVILAASRECIP